MAMPYYYLTVLRLHLEGLSQANKSFATHLIKENKHETMRGICDRLYCNTGRNGKQNHIDMETNDHLTADTLVAGDA